MVQFRKAVLVGAIVSLGATAAQGTLLDYQTAVLNTPTLISYYTFDHDAGGANSAVADVDPNGTIHNATIPDNSATMVTGAAALGGLGQSVYCDGSGSGKAQVNVSTVESDFLLANGGTVELWFNSHVLDTTRNIIGCVDSAGAYRWNVRFRPQDTPSTVGVGGVTTTDPNTNVYVTAPIEGGSFSKDTWYHLAVVFKAGGAGVQVYLNGTQALDNDTYAMKAGFENTGHLTLGSRAYNGTSTRWIGSFDEVAVYGEPLSAATIQAHYVALPEPATLSLLAAGGLWLARRRR